MGIVRNLGRKVMDKIRPYRREWRIRIKDVLASPDNQFIPRVPDAGQVRDGLQTMHNGLRILRGSYYGSTITRMLRKNRGVHEPQEERAFGVILPLIPRGGVMLELGAYWAFYSMWFLKQVERGAAYLVEPSADNLEMGKRNFEHNGVTGDFLQAYAGRANGRAPDGVRVIGVDDYMAERGIARLDILHADIQGAELDMLAGARRALEERNVGFIFISTHSNPLHYDCVKALQGHGYQILADCDLDDTYSFDGLIVAKAPGMPGPDSLEVSKKRRAATA